MSQKICTYTFSLARLRQLHPWLHQEHRWRRKEHLDHTRKLLWSQLCNPREMPVFAIWNCERQKTESITWCGASAQWSCSEEFTFEFRKMLRNVPANFWLYFAGPKTSRKFCHPELPVKSREDFTAGLLQGGQGTSITSSVWQFQSLANCDCNLRFLRTKNSSGAHSDGQSLARCDWELWRAIGAYAHNPPERNSGENSKEIFKETDEKRSELLAKFSVDFRPSISREIGHKKFHTNSSTHQDLKFHTAEPIFFHSDNLGVGGPNGGGLES